MVKTSLGIWGTMNLRVANTAAIDGIPKISAVFRFTCPCLYFGNAPTTTGTSGYLASTNRFDSVTLVCVTANTEFVVYASIGNIIVN